jgi:MYXO-CTERM domain-containing protein
MQVRSPLSHVRGGGLVTALALAAALPSCEPPSSSEQLERAESPIIGGAPDTTNRGVVSLLKQVEGGFFPSCSGTLLTQNLVLTAHHCVAPLSSGDASSVECGKTKFEATTAPGSIRVSVEQDVLKEKLEPFRVAEVWVPAGNDDVCGRDIALLMLAGAGVPGSLATPIAPRLETKLEADESFVAVGYGLQDPDDETGHTAGQRMISTDAQVFCDGVACGTEMVQDSEFIANSPVCSGDSGGPALDANGRVSGVTSRGDVKCTVGIYSSVAAWKSFIVERTFVAARSGNYVPPPWAGTPPPGYEPPEDPLGLGCTGACSLGYQCWSESSTPPGICVPPCGFGLAECPGGYSCDAELSVCTPVPPPKNQDQGCAVSAPKGSVAGVWLAFGLFALGVARRRRNVRG